MEKLVIAGAYSLEILKLIDAINREKKQFEVIGFIDDAEDKQGKTYYNIPVLGKIDQKTVSQYVDKAVFIDNIYGGNISVRIGVSKRLDSFGVRYTSLIHPSVDTNYVKIGEDCIFYQGVILSALSEIGAHSIISLGAIIAHECKLEKYCFMSPNAALTGRVTLHEGVTMGVGSVIIGDLEVGKMSLVGAGAVVVKNVPEYTTVFGNPARIIMRGTEKRRAL